MPGVLASIDLDESIPIPPGTYNLLAKHNLAKSLFTRLISYNKLIFCLTFKAFFFILENAVFYISVASRKRPGIHGLKFLFLCLLWFRDQFIKTAVSRLSTAHAEFCPWAACPSPLDWTR